MAPASPRRLEHPRDPAAERQAEELGPILGESLRHAGEARPGLLSPELRAVAEPFLGVPLGGVSLREGSPVAGGEALAATEGSIVTFGAGHLGSSTAAARGLLGHELTHVAQQRASGYRVPQYQLAAAQGNVPPRAALRAGALQRLTARGDPEVRALASRLNLTTTGPQVVRTEKIGKVDHSFQVSLLWVRDTSGGRVEEASGTAPNTHVFNMRLGWAPGTRAIPETRTDPQGRVYPYFLEPDAPGRLSFFIAELLHHELIHVQLLIDRRLELLEPGGSGRSALFQRFKKELAKSRDPMNFSVDGARQKVLKAVKDLALAASRLGVKMHHGRFPSAASHIMDTLVNERFTFRETGRRFGYTPRDAVIVPAYVERISGELLDAFVEDSIRGGHTEVAKAAGLRQAVFSSTPWSAGISALTAAIEELFKAMDLKPLGDALLAPLRSGFNLIVPGKPLPIRKSQAGKP